jgi:hypothetical protein
MAVKPAGEMCAIREQIIEDPVSGLIFQIAHVSDDQEAPVRIKVFGNLPYGNREFLFDRNGMLAGTGTALRGSCRATWLREVKG